MNTPSFPILPDVNMPDVVDRVWTWMSGVDQEDVLRWEAEIIQTVVRPGYIILAVVHLAIWMAMRVALLHRDSNARQRSLSRFIFWKAVMWSVLWERATNPFGIPAIYDNAVLIVAVFAVLGTAIDVLIRYALEYVVRPTWAFRRDPNRVRPSIPPPDAP